MQIKRAQGHKRVAWVRVEHPFTAISPAAEVHANHNEAQNSARRVEGVQRVLDVQRLIHNWVRPHWELGQKLTPAMAMGYCDRPVSITELLTTCGVHASPIKRPVP